MLDELLAGYERRVSLLGIVLLTGAPTTPQGGMTMRTATVTVYRFAELSAEAKERAKRDYAEVWGYVAGEDAIKSLEALAKHFGGALKKYGVDFFDASPSFARFDMPEDMGADEIRDTLAALGSYDAATLCGDGECKLTGYCVDEDAIDGFRIAFLRDGVTDLDALMQAAFRSWLAATQADCADFYTDAQFGEHADLNGYEYGEDGALWREKVHHG